MRPLFKTCVGLAVVLALIATTAVEAGPIRDLIRQKLAARQGGGEVAGLQKASLPYQGMDRTFYYYIPASAAGRSGVPMVFVFHGGGGGDGADVAAMSQMTTAADQMGFIAVFPNSDGRQWNDGRATTASGVDDVGYVRTLIATMAQSYGGDAGKVFAAGISNGGMFTQRLACDAAGSFRAFGVVAANFPADYAGSCQPSRAVPIVFFNGTTDGIMPWAGGEVRSSRATGAGGTVLSHDQTQALWAGLDGCSGPDAARALPDVANDGTTVSLTDYNCRGSAQLSFYAIDGGGHNWPGGSTRNNRITGQVTKDISATAEILGFFSAYGL